MEVISTTPSGLDIDCQEISESDRKFGTYVTYCKRYWGTEMKDYGNTTCLEADKYIEDNKSKWKEQAKRSKTQGHAERDTSDHAKRDTSEHEHRNLVERDTIMLDEIDELGENPT